MNSLLFKAITFILFSLNKTFCSAQGVNSSSDPCETYGRCGQFGSCNSQDSSICSCLRGFDPVNQQEWNSGNWTSGCARRVPLSSCGDNSTGTSRKDGFLELDRMKLAGYSDRWFGAESECEGRCLRNCSCMVYAVNNNGYCLFWSGNITDMQRSLTGSQLHIRVAGSQIEYKKDYRKIMKIVIVVGIIAFSISGYLCWKWAYKRRGNRSTSKDGKSSTSDSNDQDALSRVNKLDFPLFKMEVLSIATNNFSEDNKLGKGGFGSVYKGKFSNGREIAIKRLAKASGQGLQEFMNEVELISKLQHRNLVRILGCCVESKEKMLIYEFMPNKSLDVYLFDPSENTLDWTKRLNIIEGICRGLLYLHRDSRLKIIHRDLKPSNILLDNNWNPKISDFGMARIYGTTQDHVSTMRVVGTRGYMAPEYAIGGRFSDKSDVFSFGVLMLEISTGRRNSSFFQGEGSLVNLLGHIWKLWNENNAINLIDSRISSPSNHIQVLRCMNIGLLCVQELPKDRPSISSVLSMLISETIDLPVPKQPASYVKLSRSDDTGTSSGRKNSSSVNDVTLTILDGR